MAYTLSGLEQTAIMLVGWRYGEQGTKRQAMEAVAHAYGVSFDTVRQWERKHAGRDLDIVARSALAAARAKGLDRASALRRSKADFAQDSLRYNSNLTRDEWESRRWRQARRDAKAWAEVDLDSAASQYKAAKLKAKTGAR